MSEPSLEPKTSDIDPPADRVVLTAFYLLFGISILLLFYLIRGYITDIMLAFLLAGLTAKSYLKLYERLKGRRVLAAVIVTFLTVVAIVIPVSFLITRLSTEAALLVASTRENFHMDEVKEFLFGESRLAIFLRDFAKMINFDYTPQNVGDRLASAAGTVASQIYRLVNGLLSNIVSGLFHFVLIVVMHFYLLIDGRRLKQFLFRLSPLPDAQEELVVQTFKDVGRAIVVGNGLGSLIQGILGAIAMWAAGLDSVILWGTIMSIFAFLPIVGISVVVVPATVVLALNGRYVAALVFLGFCMGVSLFVDNVVKTKLIGNHMKMHDLLIFMSIVAGLTAFGVLGILYGPLVMAMFLTLSQLFMVHYAKADPAQPKLPRPECLFPLDGRRRLRRNVVDHPVDAAHLVDDAA